MMRDVPSPSISDQAPADLTRKLKTIGSIEPAAQPRTPILGTGPGVHFRAFKWLLPLAAALVVGIGFPVWFVVRTIPVAPAVVAQLRDAGGLLRLTQGGVIAAAVQFSPAESELLAAALRTGRLPAGPARLSAEGPPSSGLLRPNGEMVVSDRPEFRWLPVAGASSYKVRVLDGDSRELAHSHYQRDLSWVCDTPLPRLQPLLWEVTATRHRAPVGGPAPPELRARFGIVSAEAAREIADAEAAFPRSHLLLAILYAKAGLPTEAASELKTIEALNPGSALASTLRQSLNQPGR